MILKNRKETLKEAKEIVRARKTFEKEQKILRKAGKIPRLREQQVKESLVQFGRAGRKPIDPTFEQLAMKQIMGGGSMGSIWGANDAVRINHDLNPRMRGDLGTSQVFGLNQPQSFQGGDPETRSFFGLY